MLSGLACPSLQPVARPVEHSNRHEAKQLLPVSPAMKRDEIVGSHQPHKIDRSEAPLEKADGVDSVGAAPSAFEAGNDDPTMLRNLARCSHALAEIGQTTRLFERIARANQPPDLVQPKPLDRGEADLAMALMGWIE